MKMTNLVQLLKQGYFVMPLYLFQRRDKLNLSMEEFIFLIYLVNRGDKALFDLSKIKEDLQYETKEIMNLISLLTEKKLLSVNVHKNERGIMEEAIDLSLFYDKIGLLLVEDINTTKEENTSIYEQFEKEFGRTLSPMEYEIIKAWMDANIKEEFILRALKEATYNGVSNLRYIDKILYEWNRKGFKTIEDIERHEQERRKEMKPKTSSKEESFDYNWFDEEDHEE